VKIGQKDIQIEALEQHQERIGHPKTEGYAWWHPICWS
jgi:hypothetical protein